MMIMNLFEKISEMFDIPMNLIRVTKEKKELYPNETMLFQAMENNCVLVIKMRLMGGVRSN